MTGWPSPAVRRRIAHWSWVLIGPGLALAVVLLDPALFGLSQRSGFLHLIAFRTVLGLGCAAAAGFWWLLLLLPHPSRPVVRLVTASVLSVVAAAQLGIQWHRGWAGADRPGTADLVVLSFNTEGGATTPEQIADLTAQVHAQVVSLPENTADLTARARDRLAARGLAYQAFSKTDMPNNGGTISLLVATGLGAYRQVDTPYMGLGAVRVEPVDGRGPTLVAVHPGSPPPGFPTSEWRAAGALAVAQCAPTDDVVVAGDFNATVDHAQLHDLHGCADAAGEVGRGAEGTWPSKLPAPFAAPIDHVLIGARHFRALRTRTLRVGGSDHRALIAWLQSTG